MPVTRFQPRSSRSRRRTRRDLGPCLPLPARRARSSEALRNGRAVLGDTRVQWSLQRVRVSIPRRVTCQLFGDHSNFVGRGRRPCRRGRGVFRAGAATGPGANPGGQGTNRPSTAEGPSLTLARARASRNASRAPPVGAPSVGRPLPSPATPEFTARQHPSGNRALIYDRTSATHVRSARPNLPAHRDADGRRAFAPSRPDLRCDSERAEGRRASGGGRRGTRPPPQLYERSGLARGPQGRAPRGCLPLPSLSLPLLPLFSPESPPRAFPAGMPATLAVSPRPPRPARGCPAPASSPARRVQPPFPAGLAPSRAGHAPSCLPMFTVSHTDAPRRVLTEREMRFCATSQPGSVRPGVHPGPPVPVNKKPMGT